MNQLTKKFKKDFTRNPFKNKDNKIVLGQTPNLPILVFAAAKFVQLLTNGGVYEIFSRIGFGALFVWAWLEFFEGVNVFRRILGLMVLVFIIIN